MMQRKWFFVLGAICTLLMGLSACQSDDEGFGELRSVTFNHVVDTISNGEFSETAVKLLVGLSDFSFISSEIQSGLTSYEIQYKTTYKGQEIVASGILAYPDTGIESPLVSIHHGTIFDNNDRPSNYDDGPDGFELFAAVGYITLIPDYIGFGSSVDVFHPYYVAEYSAGNAIDFIEAAKEFLDYKNVPYSDQLFLTGYSQGGNVTMAVHKGIEELNPSGIVVTASAPGAGGYDLPNILSTFAEIEFYDSPNYFAYILNSYNTAYDWGRSYSDFFQEPYASRLPALMDGTSGGGTINAGLTKDLSALFNPDFRKVMKDRSDVDLNQALELNRLDQWVPIAPMRIYHGTADSIVPADDSQRTYDSFIKLGAENVELKLIEGGTHGASSLVPMVQDLLVWFDGMKN